MRLILASNNSVKLREFREILEPQGFEILSQAEAGVDVDPEETGTTYEENARIKAHAVWDILHAPVIADDSGLEIDALDGQPGLYTKRFDYPGKRREKILRMMEGVPPKDRTARLISTICYIDENGNESIVKGVCEGIIAEDKGGDDPTYCYELLMQDGKRLADLTESERIKVNHRGLATQEFLKVINSNN